MFVLFDLRDRGAFHEEGSTREKMKKYEDISNPLARFIENECVAEGEVPFKHFKDVFTKYLKENRNREYSNKDLRKLLQNEGYFIDPKHYFGDLGKQLTGIVGLSLKVNPYIEMDREKDGSLGDFVSSE